MVKTDRLESEVVVRIDKERLAEIVHEYLLTDVTNKKVFVPGLEDLRLSIGKHRMETSIMHYEEG